MRADDLSADSEPQAKPTRFGSEECIENALEAIRGYAVAVVRNGQMQRGAVELGVRLDLYATIFRIAILDCIARVQQQVQKHLLQLYAVSENFRQPFRDVGVELYLVGGETAANEALGFF